MTYCVGVLVREGLVMIADTRTNAGIDNIATFRKLHVFEKPGQCVMAIATAGNLAVSQSVLTLIGEGMEDRETQIVQTITDMPSMFKAAQFVGRDHSAQDIARAWQDAIGDDTRQDNDPSTILLFQGVEQVDWTTLGLAARKLGPDVLQHYEMAQDLGFRCGVSLRLGADHTGRILSGIGLWYPDHAQATVFRADLARDRDRIGRILQLFDIAVRGDHAALMIGLSVRERDALSYLAAGYRSAEASWKMKISEKTLEKHVANAKHKLNARTRDHAVAKALLMGLIAP